MQNDVTEERINCCEKNSNVLQLCLWKEILSQQRIRHFKILHFAYDVGIISSAKCMKYK